MGRRKSLFTQKFGRLTPVGFETRKIKDRSYFYWHCICDCGLKVTVASSHLLSGHTKSCGCLLKEKTGNFFRGKFGPNHPGWKGGRLDKGYRRIGINKETPFEHRMIAERALGRKLKTNETVHHVNGRKDDNRNSNFLICSRSYHSWLESKMAFLYKQEHFGGI